jgi:ferredoxin-NADP reductase
VGRRLDTGIRRRAGSSNQALATEELSGDQDRCRQPVSRLAAAWPNLGPWCWNRPMTFGCRRSLPGQYVSIFVHLPDSDRQPRQYTVSSTAVGRDSRSAFGVLGRTGAPQRSDVHLSAGQGEGGRHSRRQRTCPRFRADAFGIPPLLLARAGAGITTVLPMAEHSAPTLPRRLVMVAHAGTYRSRSYASPDWASARQFQLRRRV